MSRIKKIQFKCPICGNNELWAERTETIYQTIMPEIDINEKHGISEIVEEDDMLSDSVIVLVQCSHCDHVIVKREIGDDNDLGEQLLDWLEERGMLIDGEDNEP